MTQGFPHLSSPVDNVFLFIAAISVALLVIITGVMIYFVIRYDKRRNPTPEQVEGNPMLEIIWTVIPTLLVLAIFYYGWIGFKQMRTVPKDAMTVKVTARMWSWLFEYENGRKADMLMVPSGRPVKLLITSSDVLHSLFIPAFRVKEDAVPGMETYLWFYPDQAGAYDIFCSEYCGAGHSSMVTKVIVMPGNEFIQWYEASEEAGTERGDMAGRGLKLLNDNGCLGCHSTDGSAMAGPTLKGIFGTRVVVVTGGSEREVEIDASYLSRSILEPQADIVKGYPPIMPVVKLSDEAVASIVEYIKGLK